MDIAHSQLHYASTLDRMVAPGATWLDIGCGRQILPDWAMSPSRQRALVARASLLVGMDVDRSMLEHPLLHQRVIGFGEDMPFAAQTFDLITANMVFEHVADPRQVLREVRRILKPGGRLVFHTPNLHNYLVALASLAPDSLKRLAARWLEGRREEDVFPTLYRLNTVQAIRLAAGAFGFEAECISTNVSAGIFYTLGPLGWLECLWMKLITVMGRGDWDIGMIVSLRRPSKAKVAGVPTVAAQHSHAA